MVPVYMYSIGLNPTFSKGLGHTQFMRLGSPIKAGWWWGSYGTDAGVMMLSVPPLRPLS